jgi:hypothetical protein
MATQTFEITEYQYGFFNNAAYHNKRMLAYLYQNDNRIATIFFQDDLKAPHTDRHGQICIYYRMEDLHSVIDMLRNEKPIFLHYKETSKITQAFLTTSKEPVGEGE